MSLQTSDEEHHGSAMSYLWIETSSLKFYFNGTHLFDPSILKCKELPIRMGIGFHALILLYLEILSSSKRI
ncbi:hypothetical protein H5410_033701 [Solanum commersonii]|uniref:Uncharacterized protein n=1 Tax=Solanum commersonii TaxID=4109 RepID=A0A9J5YNK9_SOLCO|nr:hypothetical protein H5410_033701 [Solanum commersonii]